MIELRAGRNVVTVFPAAGGRLAELRVGDLELLVDSADDPLGWGCFPMLPFAGRLRHGVLRFDGRSYELPLNMAPHAIHGTVTTAEWMVDGAATADRAVLRVGLGPDWPWAGHAVHRIALSPNGLDLTLEVHADEAPMPASCGWHPWFRRRIGRADGSEAKLEVEPGAMYAKASDGIPTGELVPVRPGPWDDCFTDLAAPPRLLWPGELAVTAHSSCTDWVLFTEPAHALCVEPQTDPPDALNWRPTVVFPGRPLVATCSLRWTGA